MSAVTIGRFDERGVVATRRHEFWMPLLWFGALVCAAAPLYVPAPLPLECADGCSVPASRSWLDGLGFGATGWYWLAGLLIGALLTAQWYGWRGRQTGSPLRVTGTVATLAAGTALVLRLGWPLLGWVWFLGFVSKGGALLVIAGGLVALARAERSRLLWLVTVLFGVSAAWTTVGNPENVLYRVLGWLGIQDRNMPFAFGAAFPFLLSGGTLLAGGLLAWKDQTKSAGPGSKPLFAADVNGWAQRGQQLSREIQRLRQDNLRLHEESRLDAGTGLPNLRRLLEDLPRMHAQAQRRGQPYAVVFLDLDHFGALNKHLGDENGDAALRQVAAALTTACRRGDTVYRKGGEELVALLPDSGPRDARQAAERLRAAVEAAAIPHGGRPDTPVVTVSVGVAVHTPGEDPHSVLTRAGHQMLRAKQHGRNRVLFAG